mgnify:CR=1 FL=1
MKIQWLGTTPQNVGSGDLMARVLYAIRQDDGSNGMLLESVTLDDIEASFDDVYLGYSKEAIAATADLLRYFRDFIRSSFEKAKVPVGLSDFVTETTLASDFMSKDEARDLLHRLIDISINRKVGDYGMNPRQEERMKDFRHDAQVLDAYMNKRVRSPGARGLLRTPELKKRLPHVDNQPGSFDSATCFDSATYPAVEAECEHVERLFEILRRTLNRVPGPVKVEGCDIIEPRIIGGAAEVISILRLTDGQTITAFFRTDPTMRGPLIHRKWLLNKKDVTAFVAPEKELMISALTVAERIMPLAQRNTTAFSRQQGRSDELDAKIEALAAAIEVKEARLRDLREEVESAKAAAELDSAAAESNAERLPPAESEAQRDYLASVLRAPTLQNQDLDYLNTLLEGRIDLSAPDIPGRLRTIAERNADRGLVSTVIKQSAEFLLAEIASSAAHPPSR